MASRAEAAGPGYVGSAACVACHVEEGRRWQASHHARAMQPAEGARVLGDFDDARFDQGGRRVRFFRRGADHLIHTEGPDGKLAEFRVSHTFGVHPLQQYLLALPGGRLQAFDVAWDSRPRAEGGQRWFALEAHAEARPGEALHWTGRDLNWNFMCAGCHSTGVVKNHDPATGSYATRWADQAVGCEACHGPGAAHAARMPATADGRGLTVLTRMLRRLVFAFDGDAPIARPRGDPAAGRRTTEVCAPCHARRQQLVADPEPGAPFLDGFAPSLVERGLYHPDGQIDDEVFEYGSFAQSAMHRAGVTCTHCHDPHDGGLRAAGNALCAQCHLPARYDRTTHHGHAPDSTGAACTACHMPTKTYMGVHVRHDHRFSVPRPALSARLGTPNACSTACHVDKGPAWAAAALARRGVANDEASGEAPGDALDGAHVLAAQRRGGWVGAQSLTRGVGPARPAILRASVLAGLKGGRPLPADTALLDAARDGEGVVRLGLARALGALPAAQAVALGSRLVDDPLRAVRLEAARSLGGLPPGILPAPVRERLAARLEEALVAQGVSAERPEAQVNIAGLHLLRGDPEAAGKALEAALRIDPAFVPALVNLADLHRAGGREEDAEALLQQAIARAPWAAEPRHALALLRVRQGRRAQALPLFQEAVERAPDNGRYALVAGVALLEAGRAEEAAQLLEASRRRLPDDPDLLRLLARAEARRGRGGRAVELDAALETLLRTP